jgi:hypothetical protein
MPALPQCSHCDTNYSGGIACLSFGLGPRGQGDALLTSIGLDSDHTLAVHDWQQKRLLAKSPTDKGKVLKRCSFT